MVEVAGGGGRIEATAFSISELAFNFEVVPASSSGLK